MTDTAMDAGSEDQPQQDEASVAVSTPQATDAEETVTVEELEEQLKASRAETAAAREVVTALTQQLATSVPRSQALMARKDLERRIDTLTRNLHTLVEDKSKTLEAQKEEREGIGRQLEEGKEEVTRLKKEVESRSRVLARVEASNKDTASVLKLKEEDIVRLQKESSLARRQYDQLEKTVHRQDQRRADVEDQVKNLRGHLKVAEKQAETEERQRLKVGRQAEKLKRERDVVHRTYVKTLGTVQKHAGLVHIREMERQNAEREQLEETTRMESRVVDLAAEIETQGREVQRALHTQAVTRAHLQQSNALVDALKTDNFTIGRQLRNVKTEKEEVLDESKKASYLVTKLQQNLNARDHDLQKITSEVLILEREHEQVREAERAARSVAQERQRAIQYAEGEKLGLTHVLHDQEAALKALQKDLEEERAGKGVVATQLARRNDEVKALRERVRLLEHVLHKGDKDYVNRLQDINTLTNEVTALRDERQVLSRHVKLVDSLKVELVRLQRELIASQNKRAVLEEEIVRREKAHRWTTLKASDPSTYDLLRKNQLLQKRLVAATQRLAASEGEAAHKEREVEELRRIVERSAAQHPDAAASRAHLINQLRTKDDQIKSVTAALNMAVLAQEEGEQDRRHLRDQLAATRRRLVKYLTAETAAETANGDEPTGGWWRGRRSAGGH
ncbi:Cilia- and flagella-associated protein 58-like [Homarus americanus]|uniref:Cilia- and flagella-associated protein 58-like n=1 Tax=Homarus americanus TaxID=6706 RepID=A0A8J5K2B0_HOMAM|nr:Cilia- and flagella-associated protein 58-like [Homarus americanus]